MPKKDFFKNRQFNFNEQVRHWRNNWRNGIIRFVERVLSGRNVSDLLGGNLIQVSHLKENKTQVTRINLIESGEILTFRTKFGQGDESYLNVEEVIQPQYEIVLSELRADVRSGLLQLESGFIIDSTLAHWQRLLYRGGLSHSVAALSKNPEQLSGVWTVLPYSDYYFHTLIEDLPQVIRACRRNPNLKILTTADNPKWTFELLNLFGIPYQTTQSRNVRIEEYIAITAPRGVSAGTVNLLREKSEARIGGFSSRLLLSRGSLTSRAEPSLEDALADSLADFGFEKIDPSEMSIQDQVRIFSGAKMIIGLHGGGLSNMVWSPAGCKVIEIFNHPYRTLDFARLSTASGHNYDSFDISKIDIAEVDIQKLISDIKALIID
jgi:hypothetical protein